MSKPEDMHLREEAVRLWERSVAADDAVYQAPDSMAQAEFEALEKAALEARDAYEACPFQLVLDYDETAVRRCGISNAPLTWDDEIVEDAHTGEMFLRSALGLPPRQVDGAEQEQAA